MRGLPRLPPRVTRSLPGPPSSRIPSLTALIKRMGPGLAPGWGEGRGGPWRAPRGGRGGREFGAREEPLGRPDSLVLSERSLLQGGASLLYFGLLGGARPLGRRQELPQLLRDPGRAGRGAAGRDPAGEGGGGPAVGGAPPAAPPNTPRAHRGPRLPPKPEAATPSRVRSVSV